VTKLWLAKLGDEKRLCRRERKTKEREKETKKKGLRRRQGLFRSAPCLKVLTSLPSVAVVAMFSICKVLCRCDSPFYERRKEKNNPLSLPSLPPPFIIPPPPPPPPPP